MGDGPPPSPIGDDAAGGRAPGLLEVGRIDRAHGLRGDLVVRLTTDRTERVAPGAVLQAGDRTIEIRTSRPFQHRWLVRVVGVDDREAADALAGRTLFAEPLDDPGTLWAHQLIGCDVTDQDGIARGRVTALEANPASDLLVLDSGALVPLRFVVEGPVEGRLVVDVPAGLFDL